MRKAVLLFCFVLLTAASWAQVRNRPPQRVFDAARWVRVHRNWIATRRMEMMRAQLAQEMLVERLLAKREVYFAAHPSLSGTSYKGVEEKKAKNRIRNR